MKLNLMFMLASGAVLASVEAAPLRLLVVTSHQELSQDIRFGHAVPNANMNKGNAVLASERIMAGPDAHIETRRPCIMRKMHNKALQVFNAFRAAVGLPQIEEPIRHAGKDHGKDHDSEPIFRILPFIGTPPTFVEIKGSGNNGELVATTQGGEPVRMVTPDVRPHHGHHPHHDPHHPDHHHEPHHHHKHKPHGLKICRNSPFLKRLSFALMSLGPWEGRAVAFVLGCGIGVLLRMFWVLSVILFRAIKGRKSEETEYTVIHEYIDYEEPTTVPPPTYTYVDEKVEEEVDAKNSNVESINA